MNYTQEVEFALDDRLEQLAAGIVERIGIDPPELKAKLQPPQLRVVKGPRGVNSYCVSNRDGTKMILVGADLYPFCLQYTRAAATYFLPREPQGKRPSSFWPRARSALATTLDWISSPASSPLYPGFNLTPHQEHAARAFADYAYRFALCHELAHVVLDHVDPSPSKLRLVGGEDVEVLRASQQQEAEADKFGLDLQFKSLPDRTQIVTGLASAIYFVHITGLLVFRLSLLAHLVDHLSWKIAYTHPPNLGRNFTLLGAAKGIYSGSEAGLLKVHDSLQSLDMEVYDVANKHQEKVAASALKLVSAEVVHRGKLLTDKKQSEHGLDELDLLGNLTPDVIKELRRLFNQSPLGVLRALEPSLMEASGDSDAEEARLKSLVVKQLALTLPSEFQHFRRLTKAHRAEALA